MPKTANRYPPTLPSSSQGRAAPGTTLGVELCLRSIPCSVHLSHSWLSRLLPSTEASPSAQLPLASWPARPSRVPWLRFRACLPAPSRALSTQRQRRMAFPGLSNQLQRPAALSYGSKTAACPPQNPPTLPCSVQRPFQLISSCLPPSKPSAFYGSEPPAWPPRNLTSLLWTFHSPFSRFRASLPAPPRAFPASSGEWPFQAFPTSCSVQCILRFQDCRLPPSHASLQRPELPPAPVKTLPRFRAAACHPQNPPTPPCSVQWPLQPDLSSLLYTL